jgi:hypothetical protein
MSTTVHLGYELGTGKPVAIPLRHMVVTGQTQEAGKTTTLEALIARAGVNAVAFVTKRGEGSFANARVIQPYFREQADWKYVAAILEASRGEKMRFERAWIIRASKGARTLADVHRTVKRLLEDPKTKGINADVYLTLDAYLEDVVPHISRVHWASTVDLQPGLNVMDLGGLTTEMQHLVIRSSIEWVLKNAENTVVVVPEAWKFIPQGRGTPVKLAAEEYIRQAAGLGNYLWLDSQDIAGVEKIILKSVPVWILGVQRESNEVKRTLDQIPAGIKKPKPEQVATLGLGEFYEHRPRAGRVQSLRLREGTECRPIPARGGREGEDRRGVKLAHCKSCDAPVIWAVTVNGKRMPVDADPVVAARGFRLDDEVEGETPLAVFVQTPARHERLYVSHFSTCPNADQHRR